MRPEGLPTAFQATAAGEQTLRYMGQTDLDLRLNNGERALADEICRTAVLGESDLCRIAVRKLLNLCASQMLSLSTKPSDDIPISVLAVASQSFALRAIGRFTEPTTCPMSNASPRTTFVRDTQPQQHHRSCLNRSGARGHRPARQ